MRLVDRKVSKQACRHGPAVNKEPARADSAGAYDFALTGIERLQKESRRGAERVVTVIPQELVPWSRLHFQVFTPQPNQRRLELCDVRL